MVDKVFVAPRGRKYIGIPWKTKRKNQESRGDAICCAWCEMKEAASCDINAKYNTDKRSEATNRLVGTHLG